MLTDWNWIPCKVWRPSVGKPVLVTDGENMWIASRSEDGRWDDGDFRDNLTNITHWQDLPVPPGLLGDQGICTFISFYDKI